MLFAYSTIKTCIATTSPKIAGASNYSVCKTDIPSLLSLSTPDNSYIVYALFVLETVQTVLTGADVFYWFASGFGDLNRLTIPFASAIDVPIMESIVSAMVQSFFAYRVWILSNKKWWLFTLICLVGRLEAIRRVPYFEPPSYAVIRCQRSGSIYSRCSRSCFSPFYVGHNSAHCRRPKYMLGSPPVIVVYNTLLLYEHGTYELPSEFDLPMVLASRSGCPRPWSRIFLSPLRWFTS